jgi:heme oxygenase
MRFRLRAGTRAAHEQLDAGFAHLRLQDVAHYTLFLEANAAALLPLESALEANGIASLLPDWDRRRRRDAIVDDLAALGSPFRPPPEAGVPGGSAALWGAAYVLEGSRLGARYLAREAARSENAKVRDNTRYLLHGQEDGLWPSFVERLEAGDAAGNPEGCLAGAVLAFGLFRQAQTAVLGDRASAEPAA